MSNNNLKRYLLEFSRGWEDYVIYCKRDDNKYYMSSGHEIYDLFINKITQEIRNQIDERIYKVKGSVGESGLAGIPHISIMDKEVTTSTQKGYYIVFLFPRNAKKIYISFALGAQQFVDRYGQKNSTTKKITSAKQYWEKVFNRYAPSDKFDHMDLIDIKDKNFHREFSERIIYKANNYNAGCFFTKSYNLENDTFSENDFFDDIRKYVDSYRNIVSDPISKPMIESLDEIVFEESDKKQEVDLDYDVKEFNPNIIDAQPKKKIKKRSKGYSTNSKPSKKVGDAGEKHVYEYERNKLLKIDRSDLAEKIVKQHEDKSFFPGYDIQSFDEHGNKIYIEVKSTKEKKKSFFEISDNEVIAAREYGKDYHIYHVTNALVNPKIRRIIKNPISYVDENKMLLEPWIYKLKFSDDEK